MITLEFGILFEYPDHVFGDNQSVFSNSSKPRSVLKKNPSRISYHFIREGITKNEWRTTCLSTNLNPSDMFTKSSPGNEKKTSLTAYFLHYLD